MSVTITRDYLIKKGLQACAQACNIKTDQVILTGKAAFVAAGMLDEYQGTITFTVSHQLIPRRIKQKSLFDIAEYQPNQPPLNEVGYLHGLYYESMRQAFQRLGIPKLTNAEFIDSAKVRDAIETHMLLTQLEKDNENKTHN